MPFTNNSHISGHNENRESQSSTSPVQSRRHKSSNKQFTSSLFTLARLVHMKTMALCWSVWWTQFMCNWQKLKCYNAFVQQPCTFSMTNFYNQLSVMSRDPAAHWTSMSATLLCIQAFILLPAVISAVNPSLVHDQLQPTSPALASSSSAPNNIMPVQNTLYHKPVLRSIA